VIFQTVGPTGDAGSYQSVGRKTGPLRETPLTVISITRFVTGVPDRMGPLPSGASSIDFEHLVAKMDANHR